MPEKKSARDLVLDDPAIPQGLKDLLTVYVPMKDYDGIRKAVASGHIDPFVIPDTQPLASAISVALSSEEPKKILAALFSQDNAAFLKADVAASSYYGQTALNYYDPARFKIERTPLLDRLVAANEYSLTDLLNIAPGSATDLLQYQALRRGADAGQPREPLLHHHLGASDFTVALLDRIEQLTGSDDFLMIRNSRGETLFHRIAGLPNYQDNEQFADLASWMLQRRPLLVNDADRFGWTPLDRLISRPSGRADSMMGRLLIVSGAKLEKQIAPGFNLAAALEEHGGHRLDKAPARKLPGPASPAASVA